jgi:hypothetical protein
MLLPVNHRVVLCDRQSIVQTRGQPAHRILLRKLEWSRDGNVRKSDIFCKIDELGKNVREEGPLVLLIVIEVSDDMYDTEEARKSRSLSDWLGDSSRIPRVSWDEKKFYKTVVFTSLLVFL